MEDEDARSSMNRTRLFHLDFAFDILMHYGRCRLLGGRQISCNTMVWRSRWQPSSPLAPSASVGVYDEDAAEVEYFGNTCKLTTQE